MMSSRPLGGWRLNFLYHVLQYLLNFALIDSVIFLGEESEIRCLYRNTYYVYGVGIRYGNNIEITYMQLIILLRRYSSYDADT